MDDFELLLKDFGLSQDFKKAFCSSYDVFQSCYEGVEKACVVVPNKSFPLMSCYILSELLRFLNVEFDANRKLSKIRVFEDNYKNELAALDSCNDKAYVDTARGEIDKKYCKQRMKNKEIMKDYDKEIAVFNDYIEQVGLSKEFSDFRELVNLQKENKKTKSHKM